MQGENIRNFILSFFVNILFKDRVHCFSMQVVMNKCFLLFPENKFSVDPSCFRENCNFNSEK